MRTVGGVLAVVVILVMLFTLLLPTLSTDQGHSPDVRTSWQYDDYRPKADGIVSVTGSLETVTVGGEEYIHAKAIGQGSIVWSDWSVETVTVSKAVLDVIYLDGQSNAAQNTQDLSLAPVPGLGTSYYFGNDTRYAEAGRISSQEELDAAIADQLGTWGFQSMLDETGAVKVGDKAPGIAKAYTEATGHRVYLICGAVPGSPVRYHIPTSTSDVTNWSWQWAELVVSAAIEAVDTDLYTLEYTGIDLWLQGESDVRFSSAAYIKYWARYHDGAVDGLLGIPVTHIIVCLIANVTDESGTVNAALIQLTEDYDDTTLGASAADFTVTGGELNPDDGLHYTQKGDNIVGREWGESSVRIVLSESGGDREKTPTRTIADMVPILIVVLLVAMCAGMVVRRY